MEQSSPIEQALAAVARCRAAADRAREAALRASLALQSAREASAARSADCRTRVARAESVFRLRGDAGPPAPRRTRLNPESVRRQIGPDRVRDGAHQRVQPVRLGCRLVAPQPGDAREAQRHA